MKKKLAAITTVAILSTTLATNVYADTYKVQQGDTLSKIAKKHNTSVSQIKHINNLTSDLIFVNQSLKLSLETIAAKPLISTSTKKPVVQTPTVQKSTTTTTSTYTVVKGDTLGKIANQHNISLNDLMQWNSLDNHLIYPGQTLKVMNSSTPVEVTEQVPAAEVSTEKEQATSTSYVVQKGDTLGHISVKYGMTVAELKSLNAIPSDLIYVGQTLKVASNAISEVSNSTKESVEINKVSATNQRIIDVAKKYIGVPYGWAGVTPEAFDCSGFIYYVLQEAGSDMKRQSTDGYYSRSYYIDTPQPGDLVFFENTYKKGISHMGIYLGNNEFIHASTSLGVAISNLDEAYYKERFDGFKRFY